MSRVILLLGTPRIEQNHRLIPVDRRKAMALLAYLAVTRQAHSREALAALLFPDADSGRALAYVRNALWTLNKAPGESWAILEDETVRFNPEAGIDVDVHQFRAMLAANSTDPAACIEMLTRAVGLYRGDFMAGFTLDDCPEFEEWRFFQAEALKREYAGALERLTNDLAETRDYEGALKFARRWLALDTLHEPVHRRLMHLYAVTGQHAAAVRQYQELGRLLDTELQTQPDMETQALYEAIQARRIPERDAARAGVRATHVSPLQDDTEENSTNGHAAGQVILPPQTTPFVGREWELGEINRLMSQPECRLLTLIGPGGIGKTRLAIRAASDMAAAFPDGVYFVALTSVCYCEYVAPTIMNALTFTPGRAEEAEQQLMNFLENKKLLLVLDNFEHLLDSAELVARLLAVAPQVKILVTSRERLNLQEEWLLETGGLHFPITADATDPADYPAVRLFMQSAVRVRRDFSPDDVAAITRICHLVGGMPLALELAATWVQVLSVEQIAAEIQRSVDFLATNMRNVPERHRSLRAVFEYSWERLTPDEQSALNRLSVFRGGFQPEAAQATAGASLPVLLALVEKSLLRRNPFGAPGRFEMHELLRQYAEQKLTDSEQSDILLQHCRYYLDWLHSLTPALCSADEPRALDAIQQDLDNVRGAVRYGVDHRQFEVLNRGFHALWAFYFTRGHIEESCELMDRIERGLRHDSPLPEERLLRGRVLSVLASNYNAQGQAENRDRSVDQAMPLLREFPDNPDAAYALILLGLAKNIAGRKYPLAKELALEGLAKSEALGYRYGVGFGLYALGQIEHVCTEYAAARDHLEQSLALSREIGQPGAIAMVLGMLLQSALTRGEYDEAHTFAEEAYRLTQLTGNRCGSG